MADDRVCSAYANAGARAAIPDALASKSLGSAVVSSAPAAWHSRQVAAVVFRDPGERRTCRGGSCAVPMRRGGGVCAQQRTRSSKRLRWNSGCSTTRIIVAPLPRDKISTTSASTITNNGGRVQQQQWSQADEVRRWGSNEYWLDIFQKCTLKLKYDNERNKAKQWHEAMLNWRGRCEQARRLWLQQVCRQLSLQHIEQQLQHDRDQVQCKLEAERKCSAQLQHKLDTAERQFRDSQQKLKAHCSTIEEQDQEIHTLHSKLQAHRNTMDEQDQQIRQLTADEKAAQRRLQAHRSTIDEQDSLIKRLTAEARAKPGFDGRTSAAEPSIIEQLAAIQLTAQSKKEPSLDERIAAIQKRLVPVVEPEKPKTIQEQLAELQASTKAQTKQQNEMLAQIREMNSDGRTGKGRHKRR